MVWLIALSGALSCSLAGAAEAQDGDSEDQAEPPPGAATDPEDVAPAVPEDARGREARVLFERGIALTDEQRWSEALEYFRRSRSILERGSSAYNMAVALFRLGRYQEAVRAFDDYLGLTTLEEDGDRYLEAQRYLREMRANLGRLKLTVEPPGALVDVDGAPIPGSGEERELLLDPGSRNITISLDGYQTRRLSLPVLEGQVHERSIVLEALPAGDTVLGVHADVEDARIEVDGVEVGVGDAQLPVAPGSHRIEIFVDGDSRYDEEVELEAGGLLRVDASVAGDRDRSFFASPWPWVIVGVLVAAAVVSIAIVAAQESDPLEDYNGTTGVVLEGLRF